MLLALCAPTAECSPADPPQLNLNVKHESRIVQAAGKTSERRATRPNCGDII